MTVEKIDGTEVDYAGNAQSRAYDYNLQNVNDQTKAAYGVSIQAVYSDVTGDVQPFVAADVTINPANTITIVDHGFYTGLLVALTGTNLPTGLSATDYYIIVVDEDTIQLASSLENALAGTAVHITNAGTTDDAELTPDALSQIVKLQCSNDGENFSDISGKTVTVSASGNTLWDLGTPFFRILRVVVTPTSGAMDLELHFNSVNFS